MTDQTILTQNQPKKKADKLRSPWKKKQNNKRKPKHPE